MDEDALVRWLTGFCYSVDCRIPSPEGEEAALDLLRQRLPASPLPKTVLDRVLSVLSNFHRACLLCDLGRVGRAEVLGCLRFGATQEADGGRRLAYGEGLAFLSEAEGLQALEALYRQSVIHPDDAERSVRLNWILDDVLTDNLGTPAALALRDRLLAEQE
jgi:hypothetical protein